MWQQPVSSFDVFRVMGPKYTWNLLSKEFHRANPGADEKDIMKLVRYQYHNWMRPPCFEYALNKLFHISFNDLLQAVHPLSDLDRMGSKSFQVDVSFVFGDQDYMRIIDGNDTKKLLAKLKNKNNQYHILENSGHVLNKDNTLGLT